MTFPPLSQGEQGTKGPQGFRGPKGDTVSAVKHPSAQILYVTFKGFCFTGLLWLVPPLFERDESIPLKNEMFKSY